MVTIEKIRSSLFPNLYESFLIDDDPLSNEQDWRNVFDYPWHTEEDHCGYAMLENGKVVGMLGMVFSERRINGKLKKFCNLHTWWVREDHRGRSLALLRPVLKLDRYTITHFTPCDIVRAVSKRLGFRTLNSQIKILLPVRRPPQRSLNRPALTFDERAIENEIPDTEKQILRDHLPYGCGHLLIRDGGESCYLLYTFVIRHRFPYCHIHYISNKNVFTKHEGTVRSSLLNKHRARFIAIDARLVADVTLRCSFNFWAPAHALYKSPDVTPDHIDNLYSDVVFLKLTMLPDISHEVRRLARRLWPFSKSE